MRFRRKRRVSRRRNYKTRSRRRRGNTTRPLRIGYRM